MVPKIKLIGKLIDRKYRFSTYMSMTENGLMSKCIKHSLIQSITKHKYRELLMKVTKVIFGTLIHVTNNLIHQGLTLQIKAARDTNRTEID